MGTKIEEALTLILKKFPKYWDDDNLIKNKVIDDLRNDNTELLSVIMKDEVIKSSFFINIEDNYIFQKDKLIDVLRYKSYWHSSYTKYANKIGLTSEGKYLDYNSDVVLDFPHKDCVLEGGMTKEDMAKDEIYYHNILGKEEIDVLLEPKVFTNVKKYDSDGEHEVNTFSENDNLIIKGNNLISLHTIKKRYQGIIKQIIIDPPYNTKNGSFQYNDRFNHSTWLTFMKNRLEISHKLLSEDGSIWIMIDDDESHYLKILCDEIFGRENFITSVIWQKKYAPQNDTKWFTDNHDYILVYAKNKRVWRPNLLPRSEKQSKYYKHDDNDGRGEWRTDNVLVKSFTKDRVFGVINPNNSKEYFPPKGRCWRYSKSTFEKMIEENRIYWGKDGQGAPQVKRYLREVKQGVTPLTIWLREEVGDNQEAKKELNELEFEDSFDTPKPERLISRIIHLGSNEGDIVLDYFLGSGTTAAVCLEMNRKFIGIEQMDYVKTIVRGKLSNKLNVMDSNSSYIYMEIAKLNDKYISSILEAQDIDTLKGILNSIITSDYLNFMINSLKLDSMMVDTLQLDEIKSIAIRMLDINQLYLNYSEIDDVSHNVDEAIKQFNYSFYEVN